MVPDGRVRAVPTCPASRRRQNARPGVHRDGRSEVTSVPAPPGADISAAPPVPAPPGADIRPCPVEVNSAAATVSRQRCSLVGCGWCHHHPVRRAAR